MALKKIIEADGTDIINDVRLVNILCDFKAFDDIPASKYILRAIINDGYSKKLNAIGEWNAKADALCDQFTKSTGFQSDYVYTIFQSFAYGLGWINQINSNIPSIQQKQTPPCSPSKQHIQKQTIKEQEEASLLSKVELLNDIKALTGLEICNISFNILEKNYFKLNCEIKGKIDIKCHADFYIKVVLYDNKNAILANEKLWWNCDTLEFLGLKVKSLGFYCPSQKVDKICIFVE